MLTSLDQTPSLLAAATHEEDPRTTRIRELNDAFRTTLNPALGQVVMTPGVVDLGADAHMSILHIVRTYQGFCEDNDPRREHDFGNFYFAGNTYFFKIDYYDKAMKWGSPNPADDTVTTRVLTIMRSDEY